MATKIFKGFKQVTFEQFQTAQEANTLSGYLWFVRTEVAEGNDEYDIYFGSKHYTHFRDGEMEAIAAAVEALRADLGFAAGEFNLDGATTVKDAFDAIASAMAELTVVVEANKAATEANAAELEVLAGEVAKLLVKDVDANDKVLTVADGILSAQVGIEYTNGRIVLTGKDGEIAGFDASEFVKDSVLEDVEVATKEDGEKYIVFTWKTEGETAKTDEIKVSDFAKLYNAGTALELAEDGVTFNVKVADANNFLSVNANNELIVDDVTTDKTMLKEEITIEGGPLASDAVKAAFPGGVIPAGTDIQAVLKALLCVEIYPVPTKSTPDYSVSAATPTIKANVNNNALVEVGQTIKFETITANAVSVYGKVEPTVSGFEHGYSETVDGDVVDATSVSGAWTIEQKVNNVYELSATVSNFDGDAPATVQAAAAADCVLAAVELVAVEGTNTYSVTEDAPKYIGSYTGVESMYIVSNLGGRSEDHKSVVLEGAEDIEKDPENKTATFTVTGVYPVYTNGVTASTTDATAAAMADLAAPVSGDGTKLALMKANTSFAVSFANQGLEAYKLYLPGEWKVKTAMAINPTTAKYAIDCKDKFVANGTVTRTVQGNEVTYAVYEWASTEGPNRVKFTVA